MCSTTVMSVVEAETARRTFLRSMGAAAVGLAVLGAGKIGVENLAGLDEVLRRIDRRRRAGDAGRPLIVIGGLKTRGGSGSPVRALALV